MDLLFDWAEYGAAVCGILLLFGLTLELSSRQQRARRKAFEQTRGQRR